MGHPDRPHARRWCGVREGGDLAARRVDGRQVRRVPHDPHPADHRLDDPRCGRDGLRRCGAPYEVRLEGGGGGGGRLPEPLPHRGHAGRVHLGEVDLRDRRGVDRQGRPHRPAGARHQYQRQPGARRAGLHRSGGRTGRRHPSEGGVNMGKNVRVAYGDSAADTATLLLAAAEESDEYGADVVRTDSYGGFVVPEEIAKAAGVDYEDPGEAEGHTYSEDQIKEAEGSEMQTPGEVPADNSQQGRDEGPQGEGVEVEPVESTTQQEQAEDSEQPEKATAKKTAAKKTSGGK